jgi:glycosyltransferase involved in cell wall biosynthesis
MRILMISYGYPPVIGGVEQHVRNLSADLAKRGHQVAVATLWNEGTPEFEIDCGVHVYRIRGTVHRLSQLIFRVPGRIYVPPFPDPELAIQLNKIIEQEHPQIVHAHNWLIHSFLPLKSWKNLKLVETLHSFGLVCIRWNLLHNNITPCAGPGFLKCLRCAQDRYGIKTLPILLARQTTMEWEHHLVDRFLPVSPAVALGNRLASSRSSFEIVPNFVPDDLTSKQDDSATYLNQLPDEEFLLFVGLLTTVKGIYVLLEAYKRLKNPPPLVLIGAKWVDTPTQFPPNVIVLHSWPHDAVMAAWKRCMIGIVPSICIDASPTVTIEAMAMGRPVIGSRIGGITEQIVDGETGYLVTPGNSDDLEQAIERLLADREMRERMGLAAKEKVKEFFASTVVSKIEKIYEEVLSS